MRLGDLDALRKVVNDFYDNHFKGLVPNELITYAEAVDNAIDNAPTVEINTNDIEYKAYCKGLEDGKKIARLQGEWISVSERLPEEKINTMINDFEIVLCSTVWNDVRPYKFGKLIGHDKPHFWLVGGIMDEYVIAWQYLPKPYKKGDTE